MSVSLSVTHYPALLLSRNPGICSFLWPAATNVVALHPAPDCILTGLQMSDSYPVAASLSPLCGVYCV